MTTSDSLADLLEARFSCRGFLPDEVPQSLIEGVLREAQQVPSWCNSQPWQVIVLGKAETARFGEALYQHSAEGKAKPDIPFPTRYAGVYQDRRRTCGWQLYDAVGVEKGDRAASARQMRENFRLFGAPHFMLVTTPKDLGSYGVLDCGAFVTTTMLALQARGLASCAMASVAGYAPFVRARYAIGEDRDLLCGVAFGRADPDHPANGFRTGRAPLDEVLTWRN